MSAPAEHAGVGVTAPLGFEAAGVAAGLKASGGPDVALVVNRGPLDAAAAVFTSNRAKANPVIWSQEAIRDGRATAIVLNSGGANCFTGAFGFQTTHQTAELAAELLGTSAGDVLVASTGLIGAGDEAFRSRVLDGVRAAVPALAPTREAGEAASLAIMTTDTVPKRAEFVSPEGWTIGAMAKGAGMLAPALATMLVVITTDAALDPPQLDEHLRAATRQSFDRLDSDGCMSTNDHVTLMASGASGVVPHRAAFQEALDAVTRDLAQQLMRDAEGASHDITIEVVGAANEDDAVEVARAVARNNLFKAAAFGNDPNWGRVLAAIGTTRAAFDPYDVDVAINGVRVCHAGGPDRPREEVDMRPRAMHLRIGLNAGRATATVWTNDLTHDYVHENSAYSS